MESEKAYRMKRAKYPEEIGVSSEAIKALIDDFAENDVEVHSLMILRHGKVAYETWASPFTADTPHIMYSVSKSFTATAIGFAIEEGLITLETRMMDIFPEFAPKKTDENLEKLTVFHLLTMTAGKDPSILSDRTKNHWIKDFFDAPWAFAPGEKWKYISENQYMLSAIINRVTGMSMREYLAPRLFAPLGIRENPFWECDGNGVEAGGWGLFITTEELANFTQCYANGGKWGRKQVIPKSWVELATSKLAENKDGNFDVDGIAGYGACFWRIGAVNGFRADGMFSQFGLVLEDYDACIVMTACEITEQKTRDCIWRHFPEGFIEDDSKQSKIELPSLPALPDLPKSKIHSKFEEVLLNKKIEIKPAKTLETINFPLSVLPLFAVFMSTDKAGYFNNFSFDFGENECRMSWNEKEETNTIVCGMDGKVRFSPLHLGGVDYTASATACWVNENNLFVWVRPLGAIGQRRLRFEFSDNGSVTLHPTSYQNMFYVGNDLSYSYVSLAKTALFKNAITFSFSSIVPNVLEPKHKCKLIDR